MKEPSYYGIMTADVMHDRRLKNMADAKVLFSEITTLSNKYGYCTASNGYFAPLYGVKQNTISSWISKLRELGYIRMQLIYKEGTKQVIERRLFPITISKHTPRDPESGGYPVQTEGVSRSNGWGYPVETEEGIPFKREENNINNNITRENITTTTSAPNYRIEDAIDELEGLGINIAGGKTLLVVEYYNKLGPDVLKYVIQKVRYANKPDWKYMMPILEDYEKKGINTLEKAKQDDERHRQKSKKQYSGYSRKSKPRIDFTDSHRFDDM
ncbi:helix-turn-helix domain-containing protein [Ligilactobacillus saerimneri]|uniref:helix-turn-helix domain-containing protein n=1 Tax=Ligilactobacillus saerimneri TaxID=228229 RepID=UPI0024BBAEB6|nr:helix-turn-helix domain-containing protein [Ligilactobacillus saerimneri]